MQQMEFLVNGGHVELCALLKAAGLAASGGQAKQMVAAGEVSVDGHTELRKTAKLRGGQIVRCGGLEIRLREGDVR